MMKLYPDNYITVVIMLSTILQCCIVTFMQITLTVVVVVVESHDQFYPERNLL